MDILIDDQRSVEVTMLTLDDETEGSTQALSFSDAHSILDAWEKLAPGRRGFRYAGDEDDNEPSAIIVAEAVDHRLEMFDIEPHWDGSMTHNAYRLVDLVDTLPLKMVG